ncbi:MAG: acyltransferase family protein, partial [Oscillospiraceae bacterium]
MSQTVETTKRNGEIDFFRFIFCMMIIIMHYGYYCTAGKRVFFIGAPIGVEFFFLVCGWLMAAHIHKLSGNEKPGKATAEYLTNRLKSILPYTTIGVVLAFITASAGTGTGAFTLFKRGLVAVLEILLLPELGVGFDTYVPVLWYVSSMLFAILILYPIFVWNKD